MVMLADTGTVAVLCDVCNDDAAYHRDRYPRVTWRGYTLCRKHWQMALGGVTRAESLGLAVSLMKVNRSLQAVGEQAARTADRVNALLAAEGEDEQ